MAGLVKYMCPMTLYLDRDLFAMMSLTGLHSFVVSVRLGLVMNGLVNLQSLY